ncbi:hypothetical protein EMIHUDRAFT_455081 [Emiliania huxleyi CCMP1516]|uniref:Uncharacterized protein n=2 Tax=Emiliania huxleyi TaxID=2903 RepID=A0A0D3KKU3_EMIH1|nr:hypothetical protein EMIHUDRAFT_455081 [Emiliania huxleyi CCMP1516]EOD36378.1 hypothetical protein EMIHUDRAFT_455081 [Emiliania huxleyi CCMP1516]|eukprot:XP_005788807.1 hypothetical protein EMIHUDRAFT_455081 [Emiliania huxleyi CCMP1516]
MDALMMPSWANGGRWVGGASRPSPLRHLAAAARRAGGAAVALDGTRGGFGVASANCSAPPEAPHSWAMRMWRELGGARRALHTARSRFGIGAVPSNPAGQVEPKERGVSRERARLEVTLLGV